MVSLNVISPLLSPSLLTRLSPPLSNIIVPCRLIVLLQTTLISVQFVPTPPRVAYANLGSIFL